MFWDKFVIVLLIIVWFAGCGLFGILSFREDKIRWGLFWTTLFVLWLSFGVTAMVSCDFSFHTGFICK